MSGCQPRSGGRVKPTAQAVVQSGNDAQPRSGRKKPTGAAGFLMSGPLNFRPLHFKSLGGARVLCSSHSANQIERVSVEPAILSEHSPRCER